VIIWNPATGNLHSRLTGHTGAVTAVAMHPQQDHLITGSEDSTLLRWRSDISRPALPSPAIGVEILVPLKGRPDNLPGMKLVGVNAEKCMRFEPEGLRLSVPAGFTELDGHVALHTGVILKGDFEVTVNYEILRLPEPGNAGPETGVALSAARHSPDTCVAGVSRRVVEKGVPQFAAWATWFERVGKPSRHEGNTVLTRGKTGRLRLVRRGGELIYFASEDADGDLTFLNRIVVGPLDVQKLRLLGFTGGPNASLDARLWDLRIRADSISHGSE
jgi:hypothetical protein